MSKLPARIKVFRMRIGFHEWVVATSSQAPVALQAWGVSRNLFATSEATVTDDPKAIAAALTDIGKPVALSSAAKTVRKAAAPKLAPAEWPPAGLAKPAHRALENAKIASLKQLAAKREADVSSLHGIGPNGVASLKRALRAAGLSFKNSATAI
ncbi:MAG: hypothetical protein ABL889_07110 [Terricaulis sp.]